MLNNTRLVFLFSVWLIHVFISIRIMERHIGRDMIQNRIFGIDGTFCPSLPFWTICQSYPPITGLMMLFGHQQLGNGRTFYPGLPFSDNIGKGTPSRFFAKMFIFVFSTKKPTYEWSSTRFYYKPF